MTYLRLVFFSIQLCALYCQIGLAANTMNLFAVNIIQSTYVYTVAVIIWLIYCRYGVYVKPYSINQ